MYILCAILLSIFISSAHYQDEEYLMNNQKIECVVTDIYRLSMRVDATHYDLSFYVRNNNKYKKGSKILVNARSSDVRCANLRTTFVCISELSLIMSGALLIGLIGLIIKLLYNNYKIF